MDFGFTDEQQAIKQTAHDLLQTRLGADSLWRELCGLGWAGIAVPEAEGGQGLGVVEAALLAQELGYACAATPFLGNTLAGLAIACAGSQAQRQRWLPKLAAGERLGALALSRPHALVPDAGPDALLVLANRAAAKASLFEADAVLAVESIDPRRRHGVLAPSVTEEVAGDPLEGDVAQALDQASVVLAAELVGLCRRALDLTVTYVKERRQFGVPVGSFQAVQHTAAQMLRDTEAAAAATYYAAWAADSQPAALPLAAAMAKAVASDAGRAVTAAAIQMHGGIGFTWEADLHWLFKRAQVDAVYLGGAGEHRARIGALIAATR